MNSTMDRPFRRLVLGSLLGLLALSATAQDRSPASIERVNPDTLLHWPQMAQVVVTSSQKLAFISGQTATDRNFEPQGGDDLAAQARYALQNLKRALEAVGSSPEQVVSTTVYIVDLDSERSGLFAEAMEDALDGQPFPPHATSLIGVSSLSGPGLLVEISAVAAVP